MNKKVKSNLRWPGGKSKMCDILDHFMPNEINNYLEVFLGGGSVMMHIIQNYHPKRIIANDINNNLINYYYNVKTDSNRMIRSLIDMKNKYSS